MTQKVNGDTVFVPCPQCVGNIVARPGCRDEICPTCGGAGVCPERTAWEFQHGEVRAVMQRSIQ